MLDHTHEQRRGGHGQMATRGAKIGAIGPIATDLLAISPKAPH